MKNSLYCVFCRFLTPCCYMLLFLIVLAVIVGIIAAIVLSQVLKPPKIRLHMLGAMPFKGNYISYYDFKTNRVAVIDETLKSNSKMCFVMPLDRSNLRDADTMRRAAGRASHKTSQTQGWEESWQYLPAPMTMNAQQLFNPPIAECEGARWIQLDYVGSNQKNRKCSDCYDFCLPDYGIERDVVRGDELLNIVRRVCFYLFVPEWRTYAQANTIEQNQRDFETYYRNRNHLATAYGSTDVSDTKWIQLQKLPRKNTFQDTVEGVRRGVYGQNRPDLSYQQQNYQNGNGYNGQMQ
ncbi:unnamed protein product [Haemonchus placei]|uniref:BRICHOS domain-containing protein n=1 Tax=Haemonchus placei TaxID=6290 RepID=A0A3P7UL06_HAEPC|nr:unnamed protein product [Haemonchus placei]